MTNSPTQQAAMRWVALAVLSLICSAAGAVGLGPLQVQSGLGQPLRATLHLLGDDGTISEACIKARLETADGDFIGTPHVMLRHEQQSATIVLASQHAVREPALAISIRIECGAQVHRSYQFLLDPPAPGTDANLLPLAAMTGMQRVATNAALTVSSTGRLGVQHGVNSAEPLPPKTAARDPDPAPARVVKPRRASRPVLKLASDDAQPSYDLKLSRALSEPSSKLKFPSPELASIPQRPISTSLRDDDSSHAAEMQARSAQERAQILQAEVQVLQEQSEINRIRLDELRKTSYSSAWLAGLGSLLLASLATIAWLLWRLRLSHRISQRKWWESLTTQGGFSEEHTDLLLMQTSMLKTDFIPTTSARERHANDDLALDDERLGLTTVQ